jgi:hypothetical protein
MSLYDFIQRIELRYTSGDLPRALAQALSDQLIAGYESSGLVTRSGATRKAWDTVGEAIVSNDGFEIGVGDAEAAGGPQDQAPRGVLRQFFTDMKSAFPEEYLRPSPWKDIPQSYKGFLETQRRSGMYGGRGPDYANYLWAQEEGRSDVYIPSHPYINAAVEEWRSRVSGIIGNYAQR